MISIRTEPLLRPLWSCFVHLVLLSQHRKSWVGLCGSLHPGCTEAELCSCVYRLLWNQIMYHHSTESTSDPLKCQALMGCGVEQRMRGVQVDTTYLPFLEDGYITNISKELAESNVFTNNQRLQGLLGRGTDFPDCLTQRCMHAFPHLLFAASTR